MLEPKVPKQKLSGKSENEPHVLHYNSWLTAGGPPLVALAGRVFEVLTPPAITPGRKHRADAEGRRKACIATLAANLVLVTLSPARYIGVAMPLRNLKLSRYVRSEFSADVLRSAIAQLEEAEFITIQPAVFKEQRTVIAPTARFRDTVTEMGVSVTDILHLEGRETIELWAGSIRRHNKVEIDYADCADADRLRAEMTAINRVLNSADIRLDGLPMGPIHIVRNFHTEQPRGMATFNRHGRLYGGFWEHLAKDRRHLLTIAGEPVVDLDFVSMFIQLAYCRVAAHPPEGDLYAIPGLRGYRKAVKSVMVSLFFRESEAKRLPTSGKESLPEGWTMERFKAAASAFHPSIAHLFDTDVGFELMAMESEILVGILLALAANGIAALPMHDGIMVGASHKEFAMVTMRKTSEMKLGRALPVAEKPILKLGQITPPYGVAPGSLTVKASLL